MTERFVDRCARREARAALDRHIVFGLLTATVMLVLGGWMHWFSPGAGGPGWLVLQITGLGVLLVTLVFPAGWAPLERRFQQFASRIGHVLLVTVLAVVYFTLFLPVGLWLRRRGDNPIVEWTDQVPTAGEGWRNLVPAAHVDAPGMARRGVLAVLSFFVQRGNWILLPVLVLLMSLGLVMFFVQSSALAPFIYVLF